MVFYLFDKMYRGYIKYRRSSVDNKLYFAEKFTRRQARQDLLLTTNHKDGQIIIRGNYITIKRGQNGYSEETFSKRRKWSRNKVRRFLNHLEMEQQIEQQRSKLKTIITIVNREKYQGNETTDDTTERHQTIQQTDTNKNDKKNKNEKETIDTPPSVDYEKLWKLYPHARKTSKKNTIKNLAKLDYEEVWYAIKIYKRESELGLQNTKYIPGMELRARDFVKLADAVNEKKLLEIYKCIRETEDVKGNILRFVEDFGKEKTEELYAILEKQKKERFISSIYANGD